MGSEINESRKKANLSSLDGNYGYVSIYSLSGMAREVYTLWTKAFTILNLLQLVSIVLVHWSKAKGYIGFLLVKGFCKKAKGYRFKAYSERLIYSSGNDGGPFLTLLFSLGRLWGQWESDQLVAKSYSFVFRAR